MVIFIYSFSPFPVTWGNIIFYLVVFIYLYWSTLRELLERKVLSLETVVVSSPIQVENALVRIGKMPLGSEC